MWWHAKQTVWAYWWSSLPKKINAFGHCQSLLSTLRSNGRCLSLSCYDICDKQMWTMLRQIPKMLKNAHQNWTGRVLFVLVRHGLPMTFSPKYHNDKPHCKQCWLINTSFTWLVVVETYLTRQGTVLSLKKVVAKKKFKSTTLAHVDGFHGNSTSYLLPLTLIQWCNSTER